MHNLTPIFNYYLESKNGKEIVALFDRFFESKEGSISDLYSLDPSRIMKYTSPYDLEEEYLSVRDFLTPKPITTEDECTKYFSEIFENHVGFSSNKRYRNKQMKIFASSIIPLSLVLSQIGELFFPILYEINFSQFRNTCEYLGIDLPEPPYWTSHKKRCFYYIDICWSLYTFMKKYALSKSETCAIVYGLAPEILAESTSDALPSPSSIWMTVASPQDQKPGGALDIGKNSAIWEVSEYTKRGDIIVMYGRSPMKAIHSIWRAGSDGSNNPFSDFARRGLLINRQDVEKIHLKELREDPVFGTYPRLQSDLAGIGGSELPYYFYDAILNILKEKGFDISVLPTIEAPEFDSDDNFALEDKVSTDRVIPLIKKLGYSMDTKDKEWERETVLKLGRDRSSAEEAKKGRPDFAFYVKKGTLGQKSSPLVIECKFHMKNPKEQTEALAQGVSYARIMNAHIVAICDKIRLIVFKSDTFEFDEKRDLKFNHTWDEINGNNLLFAELAKLIGKNTIVKLMEAKKH